MSEEQVENYITELESMFELSELEEHSRNILKVGIYINKLQQENKELNNILTELEETIKNKIKGFKEDKDYFIDEKDMYELDNLIQKLKENESK